MGGARWVSSHRQLKKGRHALRGARPRAHLGRWLSAAGAARPWPFRPAGGCRSGAHQCAGTGPGNKPARPPPVVAQSTFGTAWSACASVPTSISRVPAGRRLASACRAHTGAWSGRTWPFDVPTFRRAGCGYLVVAPRRSSSSRSARVCRRLTANSTPATVTLHRPESSRTSLTRSS